MSTCLVNIFLKLVEVYRRRTVVTWRVDDGTPKSVNKLGSDLSLVTGFPIGFKKRESLTLGHLL